jgi:hypothetical protein
VEKEGQRERERGGGSVRVKKEERGENGINHDNYIRF